MGGTPASTLLTPLLAMPLRKTFKAISQQLLLDSESPDLFIVGLWALLVKGSVLNGAFTITTMQ